jgi:acetyl-CoA C-acetyltransferase
MRVIAAKDVEEIVLGHFNSGFSPQDFTASLATRVCATGSVAVHQGLKSIAARSARIVLVVGVEQMTTTPGPEVGRSAQGVVCARRALHLTI